jgi:MOSC domain-containing protein YiiM
MSSEASVVQLNISKGGVPKVAVPSVEVTRLGLAGDRHSNPQVHGGPNQAVLLITAEGIDELTAAGFPLFFGALGENITTRGLDRRSVRIGQRYRVGPAILEIFKVRGPCENLNVYGPGIQKAIYDADVKAGDPHSPRWGLSGFYASVVQHGTIRPGDPISLLDHIT